MEEDDQNKWDLTSPVCFPSFFIEMTTTDISSKTNSSNLSNDPLFSCIITLYILILLYFPHALKISLSPVLIITALLLLFLLRLGAVQSLQTENPDARQPEKAIQTEENDAKSNSFTDVEKWVEKRGFDSFNPDPNPDFEEAFVEWDVKAPLEVIYEAYEGEEACDEDPNVNGDDSDPTPIRVLDRYPSLAMYYPETDSDTSSDSDFPLNGMWDSPERGCFKWEEEDRQGLLIEIALDGGNGKKHTGLDFGFYGEEDNLIEIDISPPKAVPAFECD